MSTDRILSSRCVPVSRAVFAALLALSCAAGIPRPVHADQGGRAFREREGHGQAYRGQEFREHDFHRPEFRDGRYHHNHYYPPRGYRFSALPHNPRLIVHGGQRFYFSAGVWYRPVEGRYVVVRPPIGIFVPFLPPFYTRVWVGPYPYYYANDVYYVRSAQGYVVVDQPPGVIALAPPPGTPVPPDNAVTELGPVNKGVPEANTAPVTAAPPASTIAQGTGSQLFIYPRQGQSRAQQIRDRSDCDNWAIGQTGRDPAKAGGQMDPDYQRALGACLDGRGYTVK
jgi:hypothetical protein